MEYGPDFICIGAPKSGTTWLYRNLKLHPEVLLPPEKEVNFFHPAIQPDINVAYLRENYAHNDLKKTWGNWWQNRYCLWRNAKILQHSAFPFEWYEISLFAPRVASEYKKLFARPRGKITGDISPNYAILEPAAIAEMAKANPQAKILYFLRNPIERSWSEFRFEEKGKWVTGEYSDETMLEVIQSRAPGFKNHGDYASKLSLWEAYFPNNVHVFFYEELNQNPHLLFKKICKLLNINSKIPVTKLLTKRVNAATPYQMPDMIHAWLQETLRNEILAIHARFKNQVTSEWLTGKCETIKVLTLWERIKTKLYR